MSSKTPISEKQKKAEQSLRESEEKYRSLFNAVPIGIASANLTTGKIIDYNKAMVNISGYSSEELKKISLEKIYADPKEREKLLKTFKKAGKIRNYEIKLKRKNGRIIPVRLNIDLTQTNGRKIALATVRDITKRKKAEQALKDAYHQLQEVSELNQKILENVPASIITLNKKGDITSVNNHWAKLTGLSPQKTIGENFFKYKDAEKNGISKGLKNVIATGKTRHFYKNLYQSNTGNKKYYLHIKASPLCDDTGKIAGLISIADDITALVNIQKKLKKANQELEKKVGQRTEKLNTANKKLKKAIMLKNHFLADASHELRTPLTIMKGNLDLITRAKKDDIKIIQEETKIISKEVDRISEILTDVTILARADSEETKIKKQPVQFNPLITEVIKETKKLAQEKNLKIIKNLPEIKFSGDITKLKNLVFNLILNAIKYNKQNGWIKISLKQGKNNIKLIIEDSGIGISKKDLPYIFERFYRVDKSRHHNPHPKIKGTGLGLAICKWAAEAHKGKTKVQSKLGQGAKFTVTLPRG